MEWRKIDLGDGHYEVSDAGDVRNSLTGQILKPCKAGKYGQYLNVRLCFRGVAKGYRVHRLVALAFVPNPSGMPQVNHINGLPRDNCAVNLEWMTAKQNVQHSYRAGHRKRALTFAEAQAIRAEYARGEVTQYEIAERHGVSVTSVWKILKNETFRPEVYLATMFNAAA